MTLGQLCATTVTDVYTVPSGKQAVIKVINLVNTHATNPVTVGVFVKRGSTVVRLWPVDRKIAAKERDHDRNVLAL